ncbi:MAG: hypothetical protein ABL878_15975 [Burkholderiales bacterium]
MSSIQIDGLEPIKPQEEPDKGQEEIKVLLEEYKQLCAQAQARYAHRYHFHYLVLVIVGVLASVYIGAPDKTHVLPLLLIGPTALCPIVFLMVKQHAYIDLRYLYIEQQIRPRLQELIGTKATLLGWNLFEQRLLRMRGKWLPWFRLFSLADYVLPFLMVVYCLGAFVALKNEDWAGWERSFFAIDLTLLLITMIFWLGSRFAIPHLPLRENAATSNVLDHPNA